RGVTCASKKLAPDRALYPMEVAMPVTVNQNKPTEDPRAPAASVEEGSVTLPPALQITAISVEEAQTLRQILNDPNHPTHAGQEMPTADASVLRKKAQ